MHASRSGMKPTRRTSRPDFRPCMPSKTPSSETAAVADLISTAVLRRHLETMDRLDIEYDFLPRESEILHLHFWDAAFQKLKESGVLTFENDGKNKGCWVMRRAGTKPKTNDGETGKELDELLTDIGTHGLNPGPSGISEEDQKVIVRSNGTVGYVGKDIAYHMWKFGLLGRDFGYRKFYRYPNNHDCWISTTLTTGSDKITLTLETSQKSTTSSTRANRKRRTRSTRHFAVSVTPKQPITTPISRTRWSRSLRAVPPSLVTR